MTAPLTLGTRASPLALAQARMASVALCAAHGWAEDRVVLAEVRTSGDRIQDRPLSEVGGKALWTKELDSALREGRTRASVHSMKDVESERPEDLVIGAYLPRADVADRLIGASSLADLPQGARVGTSSPRRSAQLLRARPDLIAQPIRGNVATRLQKVARGDFDATFLAAAGLDRLGIEEGCALPTDLFLPAPGQAAVGIECRADDPDMLGLLGAIDCRTTRRAVEAERAFARTVGGTCHSPVAALALVEGDDRLWLRAQLLSADGAERVAGEVRAVPGAEVEAAIALARALLAEAPRSITALFGGG